MFVNVPLGEGEGSGWVPLRPEVDRGLLNGHAEEVTFQGGYYVAQSLTKQWQDPWLSERGHSFPKDSPRAGGCSQGGARTSLPPCHASSGAEGRGLEEGSSRQPHTRGWRRAGPDMEEVSTPLLGREGKARQ